MCDLFKWRIFCNTDNKFECIWDTHPPTTCPVNSIHKVELCSVADMVRVNKYKVVTNSLSPYILTGYNCYQCDTSTGNIIFKLKSARGVNKGRVIIIQKLTNIGAVNIYPFGIDTINGASIKTLLNDKETLKLQSDGVNWDILDVCTLTGETEGDLEGALYNDMYNNDELVMYTNDDFRKLKLNLTAIVNPTINDDYNNGYGIGSRWINTITDIEYVCVDATVGGAIWKKCCGNEASCWILSDQKSSTTNGGSAIAGGWYPRDLNTMEFTCGNEITLPPSCTNKFQVLPGKYQICITSAFCKTRATKIRLYNVTDATVVSNSINIWAETHNNAILNACINISTTKLFEIQYMCCLTRNSDGLGTAMGFTNESEKYTIVKITKM